MALARRNCAVGSGSASGWSGSGRPGFRRGPTRACCRTRLGGWRSPAGDPTVQLHVSADVILFGFVRGGFDWLLNPNPPGITSETVCTVRIRKKKSETVCTVRMCIFCNKSQKGLSVAAGHNVELSDFFSGEPTAGADIERRETRPSTLQNPAREAEYHHRRSSTVSTREHRARASSSSSSPNPASHARTANQRAPSPPESRSRRWLRRTRRPSGSSIPRSSWDARSSSTGSTACSTSNSPKWSRRVTSTATVPASSPHHHRALKFTHAAGTPQTENPTRTDGRTRPVPIPDAASLTSTTHTPTQLRPRWHPARCTARSSTPPIPASST